MSLFIYLLLRDFFVTWPSLQSASFLQWGKTRDMTGFIAEPWTRVGDLGLRRCFWLVHDLLGCVCACMCTTCVYVWVWQHAVVSPCLCMCVHLHLIAGDFIYPDTEIMFAFSFSQPCWSITKLALTAPVHQAGLGPLTHPLSYAALLRPRC